MSRFGQLSRGGFLRTATDLALKNSHKNRIFLVQINEKNGPPRFFSTSSIIGCNKNTEPPSGTTGGKGTGSRLICPKCGNACDGVNPYVSSSRFVTCDRCQHLFLVMSESESKSRGRSFSAEAAAEASAGQRANAHAMKKPPPPPKKIKEFLDKHIVGQETAKKSLSVAVYNHYKRIYHNIPVNKRDSHKYDDQHQGTMHHSSLPSQKDLLHIAGMGSTLGNFC